MELRADDFSTSSILCERIVLLEFGFEMACCSSVSQGRCILTDISTTASRFIACCEKKLEYEGMNLNVAGWIE